MFFQLFRLDENSLPAYVHFTICLGTFVLAFHFFNDDALIQKTLPSHLNSISTVREPVEVASLKSSIIQRGTFLFLFLNFTGMGVFSVVETIGTPYFIHLNHIHGVHKKIIQSSEFFGILGLLGIFTYISIIGFSMNVVRSIDTQASGTKGKDIAGADLKLLLSAWFAVAISCFFLTCSSSKIVFYISFYILWSLAYPLLQTTLLSGLSKLLSLRTASVALMKNSNLGDKSNYGTIPAATPDPAINMAKISPVEDKPQGAMMGYFGLSGSLGRIFASAISGWFPVHTIFFTVGLVGIASCFALGVFIKTLSKLRYL
eukprot:Sdes_comp20797_c0_seq2m17072